MSVVPSWLLLAWYWNAKHNADVKRLRDITRGALTRDIDRSLLSASW